MGPVVSPLMSILVVSFAAVRFGVGGGVLSALAVRVLVGLLLPQTVASRLPRVGEGWVTGTLMVGLVGGFVGLIARPATRSALERHECRAKAVEIRKGLANGEFFLLFQPIFVAETGRLSGAEALIRWRHRRHEVRSPNAFIPVAESSDLIFELDDWVLENAARQLAEWRADGVVDEKFLVGVNVSGRELDHPLLAQRCASIVQAAGVPPGNVVIEITETALGENVSDGYGHLEELRAAGFTLALDDFGVGYSSLGRLQQSTFDAIKIDRSFVSAAAENSTDLALVSTVIRLAHRLGCIAIAEGVETVEQQQLLRSLHCDRLQGYLLGLPEHPSELAKYARADEERAEISLA